MYVFPSPKIGWWNGWLFMSVFIWQMMVIWMVDEKVRNRSHVPAEARENSLEKNIGNIANLIWLLALVYSVFLPLQTSTIWFYLGLAVFLIGVIVLSAATYSFMTTPNEEPISKGVYQISRHPMYLATFLICLGCGFATGSWTMVLMSFLMAICLQPEALIEERCCLKQYGNLYRQYMQRVPRWLGIPR